jgi:hypothetical protein
LWANKAFNFYVYDRKIEEDMGIVGVKATYLDTPLMEETF